MHLFISRALSMEIDSINNILPQETPQRETNVRKFMTHFLQDSTNLSAPHSFNDDNDKSDSEMER